VVIGEDQLEQASVLKDCWRVEIIFNPLIDGLKEKAARVTEVRNTATKRRRPHFMVVQNLIAKA
jgi:hypothetical protein